MRISDWSSDVCSSDLRSQGLHAQQVDGNAHAGKQKQQAHPGQGHMPGRNGQRSPQENQGNDLGAQRDTPTCLYRSEEHTSELQSLMRISYAVFCLKKKKNKKITNKSTYYDHK